MEAGTEDSSIETLRGENDALRKEIEWTRSQHHRWAEERNDLVSAMRELRAKIALYEPEPLGPSERAAFDKLKAWSAELHVANQWYASQETKWADALREAQGWNTDLTKAASWHQTEYQQLKSVFDEQQSAITELEKARDWYAQQVSSLEEELRGARNWIVELQQARDWFAQRSGDLKK